MKSKNSLLVFTLAAASGLAFTYTVNAATVVWDRGAGTGDLNDAVNWVGDVLPPTGETIQFDNTAAGAQALTFNAAVGGTGGYLVDITAAQTGAVTITNVNVATSQNFRVIDGTSIGIANGAGAFTLGEAGAANPIQLVLGSSTVPKSYSFSNNDNDTATIHENVTINRGGDHQANLIFTGSGTWDVKGKIGNLSRQAATAATGALAVNMSGAGKVTLFADNTTGGNDTWNILVNQGTLSFSALNNLGDGTGAIRLGQTNSSGVLEFTGSAGSGVSISRQVNIGNGANALDLGSSTITASGSTTADTLTFSNAAFNLPGNTPVANAGRSLTLRGANAGLNTISGVIADNTGLGGLVRVIKDDTGTWVLNGNNTFSNGVTITGGTLQAGHDSALGTGALNMNNATTARIRSTDGTARTFTNAVTISQTAIFGAAGTGNLTFSGAVNAGAATKTWTIDGITSTFTGTISGSNSQAKDGNGTLVWSGDNAATLTGAVFINEGTLSISSATNLGSSTTALRLGQTSTSGTLLYNGGGATIITRQVSIGNGVNAGDTGDSTVTSSGAGTISFNNVAFNAPGSGTVARELTLRGTTIGNNEISGVIADNAGVGGKVALVKRDAGTWNLTGANTFSNGIQVWEGALEFNSNSALGAQTIQTRIGRTSTTGTLRHTGGSNTIVTGQVQVGFGAGGTGNAIVESSGAGTLSFSNATFNAAESAANANRTLFLGGANSGTNTISGAIVNNNNASALIGLTKQDAGTWVLGGVNTYTGSTTVSTGTLILANTGSLRFNIGATGVNNALNGAGSVTLNGGLLFNLASAGTITGNSWNIVNVGTLNEGYGGTFAVSSTLGPFSNSSGTWTRVENDVTYTFVQSTGVLSVTPGGADYSTWASAFSAPALSDTLSTADPDNDGLINAVEYALGLDPRYFSASPGVITNSGMTITYTKGAEAKANGDVTYGIETSTTLALGSWTLGTAPEVTQTADTISITFPVGPVKNFARLMVILAP
jgi:autotransporter-associated beta strand protein